MQIGNRFFKTAAGRTGLKSIADATHALMQAHAKE
jgi:hypothetical protein